jgi:2-keto-3-deoxy-L-rhamnonate aldolase RhmA
MRINHTKERLQQGQPVFGCVLQQFRSAEAARLLAAAGFDYVFVDTEHTGFDWETVQDVVSAANHAGITPLVRVTDLLYALVARALDVGAQGVIFPRVEDPALLRQAIGWTKFPPAGTRGFGISAALLDYQPRSFPEIIQHANAQTLVVVQFESDTALARVDELLSVPGVDVAMIGPADLSIALGVPGEFEHPKMIAAISDFILACGRHGVVPGIQCRSAALAEPWLQRGMRLIGCGSELTFLLERARQAITEMRAVAATIAEPR